MGQIQDRDGAKLTPSQFQTVAQIAKKEAGLILVEAKSAMISSRLNKRTRALGIPSLQSYCDLILSNEGRDELPNMISVLTTNVSHFFRESHHFDMLRDEVLPSLLSSSRTDRPLRIWSAGCSNGQEIYTIAMTVLEHCPEAFDRGTRILGSDIDLSVLQHAQRGSYDENQVSNIPRALLEKYFTAHDEAAGKRYEVKHALRQMVRINHLNLIQPWPIRSQFDVIFCRNVVIYFDEDQQFELWQRFSEALRPDGWLFVGHSERVSRNGELNLNSCGLTAYRKSAAMPNHSLAKTGT